MQPIIPKISSMLLGVLLVMVFKDYLIAPLVGAGILIAWEFVTHWVRRK